jgi:uroporphyrinogen decarboxylase
MSDEEPVFLKACRGQPTSHTPIWLMRQAGRYQASYMEIRSKVSFVELCKTPELASRVTLDAVEQLGVDASIIFADILLILEPLGIGFEFIKGSGPNIPVPLREPADVDRVSTEIEPADSLGYVMEAIRRTRAGLPKDVPLIGFAASPFTLASYAIEGGGSKDYVNTKKLMFGDEGAWHELMRRFSHAIAKYLNAQIDAGAQAIQLFDSWVGALSPADYVRFVQPHVRGIFEALGDRVPTIHFGQGNPLLYPYLKEAGGDVISVDFRTPLGETWDLLGGPEKTAIQGNLDPVSVLAPRDVMFARTDEVLAGAAGRPGHIFNLGHGILRWSTVEQAKALVDYVHERTSK